MPPIPILYCEGNVDGTVGGSYYSLLYLVKGLDRTRYRPTVVFYSEHGLLSAFQDAGAETLVWRRARQFTFGSRARGALAVVRPVLLLAQKAMNVVGELVWPAIVRFAFLKRRGVRLVHLNNTILHGHDWVYSSEVLKVFGNPADGDVISLKDGRDTLLDWTGSWNETRDFVDHVLHGTAK